jgi:hypothetical protein
MIAVLLLMIGYLILIWQLLKALLIYRDKHQELLFNQRKNYELINVYKALGQSIMALNIQLQAAQKLWQINPPQAQNSLSDAYHLSSEIMQELRQIVKLMDKEQSCSMSIDSQYFANSKSKI